MMVMAAANVTDSTNGSRHTLCSLAHPAGGYCGSAAWLKTLTSTLILENLMRLPSGPSKGRSNLQCSRVKLHSDTAFR